MMKRTSVLLAMILVLLVLSSCTSKSTMEPSGKRHATVLMQDGTRVSGAVVASSASDITLAGDDGITRTMPMKLVRSIEYHEQAPAEPTEAAKAERTGTPATRRAAPAASPASRGESRPSAAPTRSYELGAGTEIPVRSEEAIDSATAVEGQSYGAEVSKDVRDVSGSVAVPRGSKARLVIVSASQGGRIRGASDLVLTLGSVTVAGRRYEVDTADLGQRGKSGLGANKRTAEYTGGGAALGAIIGAIAGGGKGAAIGAGAGAGAGALTQILTKGKAVRVPAESELAFKLNKPLRIVAVD